MNSLKFIDCIMSYLAGHPISYNRLMLGIKGVAWPLLIFIGFIIFVYIFIKREGYLRYAPAEIALILFLLFFTVCLGTAFWVNNFNPSGDEPYYLLSAYSLAFDGDLDFYNNVTQGDWRQFYRGELLLHHRFFALPGKGNDHYYYPRGIGTQALIGLGYAAARRMGIFIFTVVAGALILVNLYHCSLKLTSDKKAAFLATLFTGFSAPVFSYSQQNYPEIFVALLVTYLVRKLFFSPSISRKGYFVVGTCIALIVLMHEKNIILAIVFLLMFIYVTRNIRAVLYALLPISIIAGFYGLFIYKIFGSFTPFSTYSPLGVGGITESLAAQFNFDQLLKGSFLGLLFDQEYGLFMYAPVYLVCGVGISLFVKLYKNKSVILIFWLVLFYYLLISCIIGWHAAEFSRYLVPIVPLLGVFIALVLNRCRQILFQRITYSLAAVSFVITFLITLWPPFRYGTDNGMNEILEKINFSGFRVTDFFPSYMALSGRTLVLSVVYVILMSVFTVIFYKKSSLEPINEKID